MSDSGISAVGRRWLEYELQKILTVGWGINYISHHYPLCEAPVFAQLYIYDNAQQAHEHRAANAFNATLDPGCYVLVERSARLEHGGYDSVVWHVVLEACASDTL